MNIHNKINLKSNTNWENILYSLMDGLIKYRSQYPYYIDYTKRNCYGIKYKVKG